MPILTAEEISKMRAAGRMAARVLTFIEPYVRPGISTGELDRLCHRFIVEHDCIPAPLNYRGFPKSICTSVNNVVCHGIPADTEILREGDIINIDVTVIKDGYHGDTSRMYAVGILAPEAELLVKRTEEAMLRGIAAVRPGAQFNDIGKAIQKYALKFGYGIVQEYTGHGIGKKFHDEPQVLHYDTGFKGARMLAGMAFTVEPMINASNEWRTQTDAKDGWTVRTTDGALSAQFEHTVLVTPAGVDILTRIE